MYRMRQVQKSERNNCLHVQSGSSNLLLRLRPAAQEVNEFLQAGKGKVKCLCCRHKAKWTSLRQALETGSYGGSFLRTRMETDGDAS